MKPYVVGALAGMVCAAAATADTLTGSYEGSLHQIVNVTKGASTFDQGTNIFSWTRSDSPGAGVDATIENEFDAYCSEFDQGIAEGNTYTFQVKTPAAAGVSAGDELLLGRLWASFFDGVDSPTESAAFQVTIWEILIDAGEDFTTGTLKVNAPPAVLAQAQAYVSTITDGGYSGGVDVLRFLTNVAVQDQITRIPSPAVLSLPGVAGLALLRRRRA